MPISSDLLSAITSFLITVLILSYLLSDNPLFRAAIFVFIGVAAGYIAAVAWNEVIYPLLVQPIGSGEIFSAKVENILLVFPLLGSALLLLKTSPHLSRLGQLPVSYLIGVGAAVAIGGAVQGTLLPQIISSIDVFDKSLMLNFVSLIFYGLILLGVISTLTYFHFGARPQADGSTRQNPIINILTWIGRFYIAITFGVLFAGVYMAALTTLIERLDSMRNYILIVLRSFL